MLADVEELVDELGLELLINDRDGKRRGFALEKVSIVCCLKMKLEVFRKWNRV